MRIALVEDEPDHAAQLLAPLQDAGHNCRVFATGSLFLQSVCVETYDAVILDWGLPDMTGIEILDAVRLRHEALPVLFISCRDAENDVVEALMRGADDFIVKPARKAELLARLDALTRRKAGKLQSGHIHAPPYIFDLTRREVTIDGVPVELPPRLFHLATVFFGKASILLSRAYLMETVWGQEERVKTRTLDFHVSQLRTALKMPENNWRIASIYAHGYRLERMRTDALKPAPPRTASLHFSPRVAQPYLTQ